MKKLVPLIMAAILAYAILKDEKVIEVTTTNNNQVIFSKNHVNSNPSTLQQRRD